MREEETEATINPMSIDGFLVEFTRPEILSVENGWKCLNCAFEFVNGSDNLEKKIVKEDKGMEINCRLNARLV